MKLSEKVRHSEKWVITKGKTETFSQPITKGRGSYSLKLRLGILNVGLLCSGTHIPVIQIPLSNSSELM